MEYTIFSLIEISAGCAASVESQLAKFVPRRNRSPEPIAGTDRRNHFFFAKKIRIPIETARSLAQLGRFNFRN
jgi:hypothetical protein